MRGEGATSQGGQLLGPARDDGAQQVFFRAAMKRDQTRPGRTPASAAMSRTDASS
jgi:hypothetical protein